MMRLRLPAPLLAELDAVATRRQYSDEITEREDAFLLDPGLGPATYLTRDGRVIIDSRGWDESGIHEGDDREAITALIVGAEKTGVAGLLNLLPKRPKGAPGCTMCNGRRWLIMGTDAGTGAPGQVVCVECGGLGWVWQ